MAYSGYIKFITENDLTAIVEETEAGADYFHKHAVVNSDFSGKDRGDTISYDYTIGANNGRTITIL